MTGLLYEDKSACFYPRGASDARVLAIIVCLSVCLCVSVCVSVTRRYCIKTNKSRIRQTTPRDSPDTLVFWRQKLLMDDPPFSWNLHSKWPTPLLKPQFRPISAHSSSIVTASEKSSISTNRNSTTRFPTSHRWTMCTLPLSPPKGGTKRDFAVFASKIQRLSIKSLLQVQSFFVWKLPAAKL